MTYVVIDNCIACKYTDCVEVCPVDCFYEGENMLVIPNVPPMPSVPTPSRTWRNGSPSTANTRCNGR